MIIHEPEICHENGEVVLQARVETRQKSAVPDMLWFRYPERFTDFLSLRADSFIGTLILVSSSLGENIDCRGAVSPRLAYNLAEYLAIFAHWRPDIFRPIQIHTPQLIPAPALQTERLYASAFSGGVDSFFTLKQSLFPEDGQPTWPVRHVFFLHGSPDIPLVYVRKYQRFKADYTALCDELGIDLIPVRTNVMQFSAPTIQMSSFLEAPLFGCASALSPLLSGVLVSGGRSYFNYRETAAGPITTHLLSTESFESFEHGTAFTRLEKTRVIANWMPAQKHLRVCLGYMHQSDEPNCSHCSKCMRTRMDLHVLGALKDFHTFDTHFKLKDYLQWGRWMTIGLGWERDVLKHAWRHNKSLLPMVLPGVVIGYLRHWLKKYLPRRLLRQIFKFTAEVNPYPIFMQRLPDDQPGQDKKETE